jgi:hypothetical protein
MWILIADVAAVVASSSVSEVAVVCPCSDWDPGTVHFCERRLCATIVEPSNAWSSLGYVLLGLVMLARSRSAIAVAVAAAQIMIGVGSFFFHGTGTFAGEVVDQIGMFMLSSLILAASLAQQRGWSGTKTVAVYVAGVVVSTGAILVVRPLGIPLFAAQLAAGLGLQLWLWRSASDADKPVFALFLSGLGIFLVSFAIWTTDISGLICDPDNHFVTGHAIWHVLHAICIWRLSMFYRARLG